jgi:hypothetical protein
MRDVGEDLRAVRDSLWRPWRERTVLTGFARGAALRFLRVPHIPVRSRELGPHARALGRLIRRFGLAVTGTLIRHREAILDRQLVQQPIAQAAMELFASLCVLSRRDAELRAGNGRDVPVRDLRPDAAGTIAASWEPAAAALFLTQSTRRIGQALRHLRDHDNAAITRAADDVLEWR